MYVCHCRIVTDRQIIDAIDAVRANRQLPDAADVDALKAIARQCGAGGHCGGCLPEVARLLAEYQEERLATL